MATPFVHSVHSALRRFALTLSLVMFCLGLSLMAPSVQAQEATVKETEEIIETYPFDDPSPVPILTDRTREEQIYPYFRFDGFSHQARKQKWTVVTLENEYIKVQVLPEVGGKVWGAIEKSTGEEFIYKNEVLKFRDIGMRGPWTSGGIEFNFGSIGHTPSTATPVNYRLRENPDGSVSCIIGAPDLPSRTRWQVEIRLPADKAYFETYSRWFNDSPLHQASYHWLNSAQLARDDLQFFFPGTHYIGHGGDLHPWPVNSKGRDLSWYRHNDFGDNKSYHVIGKASEYFGGYWHRTDFGYGQWGRHQDYPGQKLWIWSLSREGAIWEDLLTDTSGQYIESQAGWFYNQANLASGRKSPFTQQALPPRATHSARSIWFPYRTIGGMVDASPEGVLNVEHRDGGLYVGVSALQHVEKQLRITVGDSIIAREDLEMNPMEVVERTIPLPDSRTEKPVRVQVGEGSLSYSSGTLGLDRPLKSSHSYDSGSAEALFRQGEEQLRYRFYKEALASYLACLEKEPLHLRAHVRIAEIYFRQGRYDDGLRHAENALGISTYDAGANYYYGLLQEVVGNAEDARVAFGWAARDPEYRVAATQALANLALRQGEPERALRRASEVLKADGDNISALKTVAIARRLLDRSQQAHAALDSLQAIDPLSHLARFERSLLDSSANRSTDFTEHIQYEFDEQVLLELAIQYADLNLTDDARRLLSAAPGHPLVLYWRAFLMRHEMPEESQKLLSKAVSMSPELIYPYRRETLEVLRWADRVGNHWKTDYYIGLIYWGKEQPERTWKQWATLGGEPEFAPFYITRGILGSELEAGDPAEDFDRAIGLDPDEWRGWHWKLKYALDQDQGAEVVDVGGRARERFPSNYVIGMDYARVLLAASRYDTCLDVLNDLQVLPYEGATEGHRLWVAAHLHRGVELLNNEKPDGAIEHFQAAKQWPENLGVGRPYHPDTRMADYLTARSLQASGSDEQAVDTLRSIITYTRQHRPQPDARDYFAMVAYRELGQKEKAVSLLADLRDDRGNVPMVQWMDARLEGDRQEAARVVDQLRSAGPEETAPWSAEAATSGFQMMVEVMESVERP